MHILVASNLTAAASRAVERAHQLAADTGAGVTLVHVVDSDSPGADAAHDQLKAEAAHASTWSGITAAIETVALGDDAGMSALAGIAGRTRADLFVMGAHAVSRRRTGGFMHSLAGRTLSALGLPVLIAEQPVSGPYGSAVIGIDFSPFSRTAIRAAHRFAPAALLHLLHAYSVPFKSWLMDGSFAEDYAYGERLAFAEFLAEEMDLVKQRAHSAGVSDALVRTYLREGDPVMLLRQLVSETGAPLAIVGTSGRTGIARLLLGSVAADLLDNPPTDMLVTPMAIPA